MTTGAVRRVLIAAQSERTELVSVLRLSAAIAVGAWLFVVSNRAALRDGATRQESLLPFQVLVQDRSWSEQRIFRELQEGLLEAEARRASTGAWPAVSVLAGDLVPPFATDPTTKGQRYNWRLIQGGTSVNYLGIPERPDAPAWLLLVLEPEEGAAPDPAREDQEHHRVTTGAMLHVSTWVHPSGGRLESRIVRSPQAEGWTQLFAVRPSVARAR